MSPARATEIIVDDNHILPSEFPPVLSARIGDDGSAGYAPIDQMWTA
jgi:hypothetical protein